MSPCDDNRVRRIDWCCRPMAARRQRSATPRTPSSRASEPNTRPGRDLCDVAPLLGFQVTTEFDARSRRVERSFAPVPAPQPRGRCVAGLLAQTRHRKSTAATTSFASTPRSSRTRTCASTPSRRTTCCYRPRAGRWRSWYPAYVAATPRWRLLYPTPATRTVTTAGFAASNDELLCEEALGPDVPSRRTAADPPGQDSPYMAAFSQIWSSPSQFVSCSAAAARRAWRPRTSRAGYTRPTRP